MLLRSLSVFSTMLCLALVSACGNNPGESPNPNKAKPNLHNVADAYVLPSAWEGTTENNKTQILDEIRFSTTTDSSNRHFKFWARSPYLGEKLVQEQNSPYAFRKLTLNINFTEWPVFLRAESGSAAVQYECPAGSFSPGAHYYAPAFKLTQVSDTRLIIEFEIHPIATNAFPCEPSKGNKVILIQLKDMHGNAFIDLTTQID